MEGKEHYQLIKLPNEDWRHCGEALRLSPWAARALARFGLFRLNYGATDGSYGVMMVTGPPGVGKSDAVRGAADRLIRECGGSGNAMLINAGGMMDEHLGRSQRYAQELIEAIEFSALKHKTIVLWDDAEAVFVSRRQAAESHDPTDVGKVSTVLFQGLDRLRYNANVVHYATLNIEGLVDEAILSRCDMTLAFTLPSFEERVEILRPRVAGLVDEGVLRQLAGATEGYSGRDLGKITLRAFLHGSGERLEDLTVNDFLRAVGLAPKDEAEQCEDEISEPTVVQQMEEREEGAVWTSVSRNGSPAAHKPRKSRWSMRWR